MNSIEPFPGYYVLVPGYPHLTHRHTTLWKAEKQKEVLEHSGYKDVLIKTVGQAPGFGEGHYVE